MAYTSNYTGLQIDAMLSQIERRDLVYTVNSYEELSTLNIPDGNFAGVVFDGPVEYNVYDLDYPNREQMMELLSEAAFEQTVDPVALILKLFSLFPKVEKIKLIAPEEILELSSPLFIHLNMSSDGQTGRIGMMGFTGDIITHIEAGIDEEGNEVQESFEYTVFNVDENGTISVNQDSVNLVNKALSSYEWLVLTEEAMGVISDNGNESESQDEAIEYYNSILKIINRTIIDESYVKEQGGFEKLAKSRDVSKIIETLAKKVDSRKIFVVPDGSTGMEIVSWNWTYIIKNSDSMFLMFQEELVPNKELSEVFAYLINVGEFECGTHTMSFGSVSLDRNTMYEVRIIAISNDNGYDFHPSIRPIGLNETVSSGEKQDVIEDLEAIRQGALLGKTALQSVPSEYTTETEVNNMLSKLESRINSKISSAITTTLNTAV